MRHCYGIGPDGRRRPGTLSRREFLAAAAAAATAAHVPGWLAGPLPAATAAPAGTAGTAATATSSAAALTGRVPLDQISIQMFTLQEQTRTDLAGTLQALAEIGYRKVEMVEQSGVSAAELRQMCDDAGITCSSSHVRVPFPFVESQWRQACEDAVVLGQTWINDPASTVALSTGVLGTGIPSLLWGRYLEALNQAAVIGEEHGLRVGYHNHDWEYRPLADDPSRLAIEMMLAETDPELVHMEMDLYWVHTAEQDAVAFLEAHPDRYQQFHVKDAATDGSITDPGRGVIDFPRIFAVGERIGIREHIVEHDNAGARALEVAQIGYDYLRDVRFGAAATGVVRLAGADRYDTAARASADRFGAGSEAAVVASGADFPDGLAGGPFAAATGGPLLLVERDRLPEVTAEELARLGTRGIVVLGGEQAIGDAVVAQLRELTGGEVIRRAGADRYATAAAASEGRFAPGAAVAYVASGATYADALAAGGAAAALGGPLLLTAPDALPAATAEELRRLEPARIVVVGGPAAVSTQVEADLRELGPTTRIAGDDRYATAALVVADAFAEPVAEVYVASGLEFADALAATAVAGAVGAPVLPVDPAGLAPQVEAEIRRLAPSRIVLAGGPAALPSGVEAQLQALVS